MGGLYVACIFFMLISMGVLAFYAIQQVAQAGWSPVFCLELCKEFYLPSSWFVIYYF
jgi:hypothetical protein